jgi:hypothetical protein
MSSTYNCNYIAVSSFTYNPSSADLCKLGFIIKQQWTIEEMSIFSNSSHLEWRAKLSDTILEWDYPRTIPAKFDLAVSEKI